MITLITLLSQPILRFAVHEDGVLQVLSAWFPCVFFSSEVLACADGTRFEIRGDEAIFRCTNGGATYALSPASEAGVRAGRLLRSWP